MLTMARCLKFGVGKIVPVYLCKPVPIPCTEYGGRLKYVCGKATAERIMVWGTCDGVSACIRGRLPGGGAAQRGDQKLTMDSWSG